MSRRAVLSTDRPIPGAGACLFCAGCLAAWGMAGLNQYSHAAQESFDVSAIVTPGCLVQGGSAQGGRWGVLDFGRHSALSQAVVTTSLTPSESIRLQCTRGLSLSMSVNQGQHYNSGTRQLQNAEGGQVGYRLYSDSARSDELLPGQATSLMAPEDGTDLQLPLYGRLQLGPNVPPGTYTDQLVVTLSW